MHVLFYISDKKYDSIDNKIYLTHVELHIYANFKII